MFYKYYIILIIQELLSKFEKLYIDLIYIEFILNINLKEDLLLYWKIRNQKKTIENKIIYKIFVLLVKLTSTTTRQAIIVACLALSYKK